MTKKQGIFISVLLIIICVVVCAVVIYSIFVLHKTEKTKETIVTVRDPYTKEIVYVHTYDGDQRIFLDDGVYSIYVDGIRKSFSGYLIESTVRSK